jgi:hypothetical protein
MMHSLKRGVRFEGEESPVGPERAWFLSEGEKSEGRMGADFSRWEKSACDESSTLTPSLKRFIQRFY